LDGEGVDVVGFQPGAVNLEAVAGEGSEPGLGHLRAAGIAGAKEEDFGFWGLSHMVASFFCFSHYTRRF
jgi:hypothetical protein